MHTAHRFQGNTALTAVEGCVAAIRVLVCFDSPTYAAGLRRLLESSCEIQVVAIHDSPESAVAAMSNVLPDLVMVDVELPGMKGVEAVERIMRAHPVPIVVFSSRTKRGGEISAAARAAGAVAAYPKGDLELCDPDGLGAMVFRRRVRALASCAGPQRA